ALQRLIVTAGKLRGHCDDNKDEGKLAVHASTTSTVCASTFWVACVSLSNVPSRGAISKNRYFDISSWSVAAIWSKRIPLEYRVTLLKVYGWLRITFPTARIVRAGRSSSRSSVLPSLNGW